MRIRYDRDHNQKFNQGESPALSFSNPKWSHLSAPHLNI